MVKYGIHPFFLYLDNVCKVTPRYSLSSWLEIGFEEVGAIAFWLISSSILSRRIKRNATASGSFPG